MIPPHHLLIIKPSSFGDIVHALPVLRLLKRHWPHALIDWLVKEEWAELLVDQPAINEVLRFPKKFSAWRDMRRSLRERGYDLVIDLQGLLRSGFAGLLTQAQARVGFADGREGSRWCYTKRIQCSPEAIHAVDRNIDVLRQLGVPVDGPVTFPLTVPAAAARWVEDIWRRELIVDQEYTVVLHPAARGETKRWPAERFAQVADQLSTSIGARIILVAAKEQIGHVDEVMRHVRAHAINLAGASSLLELAALMKKASLVISNDSGPMHLAAAVGTSVIGLFGPTDPRRIGPYGPGHVALKKQFDCSACSRRVCVRDHGCLKAISVDDVLTACSPFLQNPRIQHEPPELSSSAS
jgi:lipopolysaccharide heptosyltransferase I